MTRQGLRLWSGVITFKKRPVGGGNKHVPRLNFQRNDPFDSPLLQDVERQAAQDRVVLQAMVHSVAVPILVCDDAQIPVKPIFDPPKANGQRR